MDIEHQQNDHHGDDGVAQVRQRDVDKCVPNAPSVHFEAFVQFHWNGLKGAEKEKQAAVRDFLAKAAQKLRDEHVDDAAYQSARPRRESSDDIMAEVNELRAMHGTSSLPGAGD